VNYEQAAIVGKRRRLDAVAALSLYLHERATEVCAVRAAEGQGIDAREWEPVGEENLKEICIRAGAGWDKEAFLLVVDGKGAVKACSQKAYPLPIALQLAWAFALPTYAGPGGALMAEAQEEAMRKAQQIAQLPEV